MMPGHLDQAWEEELGSSSSGAGKSGWLQQIVGLILDESDDAFRSRWVGGLCNDLPGLDEPMPFEVVHNWYASAVSSLVIESCEQRGLSVQIHLDVRELHRRASRGQAVAEDEWHRTLEPAMRVVYEHSYPRDEAFATAAEAAWRYAGSHNYEQDAAETYRDHYASINTAAAVRLYSAANAMANSNAYARAFAHEDHALLSAAYPGAYLRACVSLSRNDRTAVYVALGEALTDCMQGFRGTTD